MRNCEEFEILANLVVDEEATLEERVELTKHLETCPDCQAYLEDIKRIHGSFVQKAAMVPEGFSAHVMERVRETAQDQPAVKKTVVFPRWRRWAALAACCAIAVLSVWAIRESGGVRDAAVTADQARPEAAMDTRSAVDEPSAQSMDKMNKNSVEDGAAAMSDEAPLPLPEETADPVRSFAKESSREDGGQTPSEPEPDPDLSASLTADSDGTGQGRDALPASSDYDQSQETGDDRASEDGTEQTESAGETQDSEPSLPTPEELPEVEPVEVLGVPEPGILITYGTAAQGWVEQTLGLLWANGGSYPLTAEQYSDLLQTLDRAGESYRIAPGEGYCLMTE